LSEISEKCTEILTFPLRESILTCPIPCSCDKGFVPPVASDNRWGVIMMVHGGNLLKLGLVLKQQKWKE